MHANPFPCLVDWRFLDLQVFRTLSLTISKHSTASRTSRVGTRLSYMPTTIKKKNTPETTGCFPVIYLFGCSLLNKNSSSLLIQALLAWLHCILTAPHCGCFYDCPPPPMSWPEQSCFSATWTLSGHLVHPGKSCILPLPHPRPIHPWGDVGRPGTGTTESGKRELYL